MAKKQAAQDAPAADKKPSGKLKIIVLGLVALLVIVGATVAATWFFLGKNSDASAPAAEEAAAAEPVRKPAIYEELTPAFVVNFSDNGRARYMQVSVALMSRDQAALDALKVHMPVLRNKLVMLFSSQQFASVATPVGKEMLRQQATASVQELAQKEIGKLAVEQVLFTNIVVQ